MRPASRLAANAALAAALLAAHVARAGDGPPRDPWQLPPEGACAPEAGLRGWPAGSDAGPVPFAPGDVFSLDTLPALAPYLPPLVWQLRERFFHEGMRLEIGPCFRDYAPPAFYREASARLAGRAHLLDNGGLAGHLAGTPFPPREIDPAAPDAGLRWAWNVVHRYQAAGFRGRFRISDLRGRIGRAEPFEGEIFKLQLAARADRADADYHVDLARSKLWVAGGLFTTPFLAREYAWRQYRDRAHEGSPRRSDDLHVYLPELRRVRRLGAHQVEGLFLPAFSVGVSPALGGGGSVDAGSATAGNLGSIYARRSGFEGLELRPHLYDVRVVGLHDVLAPFNVARPMYPTAPDRDFGPWGLSLASDRWELRRALVLEFSRRSPSDEDLVWRVVGYYDLQTLQPLYYVSRDHRDELIDVGIFAGRWSDDRADYPRWPDDPERPVRVIDSVAAAFANVEMRGSWRRESWEMVSTPPPDRELERLISVDTLTRRH